MINKEIEAVELLMFQTQDGQLKWQASKPSEDITRGTDRVVDTVYRAEKGNRSIRLYRYSYRHYMDIEDWFWYKKVALELSDETKTSWYRFPDHAVIDALIDTVEFKTVNLDQFISSLKEADAG